MDVELAMHREILARTVDLIREGPTLTVSELSLLSGCAESVIDACVQELLDCGLIADDGSHPTLQPRALTFRHDSGTILVAELSASRTSVGATNLAGQLIERRHLPTDLTGGPEAALHTVERLLDQLIDDLPASAAPIWGISIGLLGAVDSVSGRTMGDPLMAGWCDYPVREWFSEKYNVPVWIDNDVNMMAVGEMKAGAGRGQHNLIYLNMSETIRVGIVSNGRLHRGAQGTAGEIGHVSVVEEPPIPCWCGGTGRLVRFAGGDVLAASATLLTGHDDGVLADRIARNGHLTARDVAEAAVSGDTASVDIINRAGTLTGKALANLVNTFNPAQILIGGSTAAAGEILLDSIKRAVHQRALADATRHLEIRYSPLSDTSALVGAAFTAIDQLLSRDILSIWSPHGTPIGLATQIHARQER